jgi:hypothetical protein
MKTAVQILSESSMYWTFPLAQRLALVKEWRRDRDTALYRSRVVNWLRTGQWPVVLAATS